MKKFILGALLALVSFAAQADTCVDHWCSNVTIEYLYTANDGNVYVGTSGNSTPGTLNCTLYGSAPYYLTLAATDPGFKNMYANILAAQNRNAKVLIRTADNSPNCQILYVVTMK